MHIKLMRAFGVFLLAALLAAGASPAWADERRTRIAPVESPGSQMRGLGVLQERATHASMSRPSVSQAGSAVTATSDDDVRSAYACLIGGLSAVAVSFALGGEHVTNMLAGGVVAAQAPTALYIGLVGVVFATFCSLSQSLLPIYTHHLQ